MAHMVSSAGVPMTVTTGVALRTVMRNDCPSLPLSRASSTPTGALRRKKRDPRSLPHSACESPSLSSRGSQPSAARRTSSWWTKYSTVFAFSSKPGIANGDSLGGPARKVSISSG